MENTMYKTKRIKYFNYLEKMRNVLYYRIKGNKIMWDLFPKK